MKKLFLPLMALLLSLGCISWGYPSLLGPSGGTNQPTAEIQQRDSIAVAIDFLNSSSGDNDLNAGNSILTRLQLGIANDIECGLTFAAQQDDMATPPAESANYNRLGINVKLAQAISQRAKIAVGANYLNYLNRPAGETNAFTQLYLVADDRINLDNDTNNKLFASVGVSCLLWQNGSKKNSSFRPFVSLTGLFPQGFSITGEYKFEDVDADAAPLTSLTARYPFTSNLSGQIGINNSSHGFFGGKNHQLFIGVNMQFGKGY